MLKEQEVALEENESETNTNIEESNSHALAHRL